MADKLMFKNELMDIESLVTQIVDYKDEKGISMLNKYSVGFLVSLIEKDKINQLEKKFKEFDRKGVDIIDFVRIFLNLIEHSEDETLFLVISLIEFFRVVSENLNMTTFVKCSDITNYICEYFGERQMDDYILPTKKLPEPRHFTSLQSVNKSLIDIEAPYVYGTSDFLLRRLISSKLITDSSHHNNQSIKMGEYAKSIERVLTLDSLSDTINLYNSDCQLERKISPNQKSQKKDVIILSFAWSDRQQRIGCTLKDYSLTFWDASDRFKVEKNFFISSFAYDYQTNIWYIEFMNVWITTDRSNSIYIWDIENEVLSYQISYPKIITLSIIDLIPIPFMKLIAISALDRQLTIWDFNSKLLILKINLSQGGIHSLKFFNTYQVLITAGYENTISIWEINPNFLDHSHLGTLIGHNSMVTAIQCIEKTPMVVSADDSGIVKIWDIRSFKCFQTVDLCAKSIISRILDIDGFQKLCFVSSRVNFIEFDSQNDRRVGEDVFPLKVEFNYLNDELVICTRKDVRFIDLEKGRIGRIFQGLLRNNDDDITSFKCVDQNRKFVIGDHRGGLTMFSLLTGEKLNQLESHINEVSILKVDFSNKIYITSGSDSCILLQKEENSNSNNFESIRTITNMYSGKGVTLMEISVYHNMLITASNTPILYLWDYEYFKLLGTIELPDQTEPTSLLFLNGYSLLFIGSNNQFLYIVEIKSNDQTISARLLSTINLSLESVSELYYSPSIDTQSKTTSISNKLLVDLIYYPHSEELDEVKLYIGFLKGNIRIYDIVKIFRDNYLTILPNANKRTNYNAYRKLNENFIEAIKKIKANNFPLSDFHDIDENITPIISFQAHKDSLTTLILINLTEKAILTSSLDSYIKIWNLKGVKLAAFNINHALPLIWDIQIDKLKRTRKNILFALKIIELIFRRYKRSILFSEEKLLNINNFLSNLASKPAQKKTENIKIQKIPVLLMKDEYSPRDLQYESIKHIYQRELMGPSLKEMENNKRLLIAQKIWKLSNEKSKEAEFLTKLENEKNKWEDKIHKDKDPMTFFDIQFRGRLAKGNNIGDDEFTEPAQKLSKKMEKFIKKKKFENSPILLPEVKIPKIQEKVVKNIKNNIILNNTKSKITEETQFSKQKNSLNIFEYATQKRLLSENSSLMTSKYGKINEKTCFSQLLKNIDNKLKTSQTSFLKTNWYESENNNFNSTFEIKKKKHVKKLNKILDKSVKKSVEEKKEDDIDQMLMDIVKNVKEKISLKISKELEIQRKNKENEERMKLAKIKNVETKKEGGGFMGLSSVFTKMQEKLL